MRQFIEQLDPSMVTSLGSDIEAGLRVAVDRFTKSRVKGGRVVLVSDGEDDPTAAPDLRARAAARGVSVFGLAIGMPGSVLAPWCDEAHGVTNLQTLEPAAANALFG